MSFKKEQKNKDMNEKHSILQLLTCQDCCFDFYETSDFGLTVWTEVQHAQQRRHFHK